VLSSAYLYQFIKHVTSYRQLTRRRNNWNSHPSWPRLEKPSVSLWQLLRCMKLVEYHTVLQWSLRSYCCSLNRHRSYVDHCKTCLPRLGNRWMCCHRLRTDVVRCLSWWSEMQLYYQEHLWTSVSSSPAYSPKPQTPLLLAPLCRPLVVCLLCLVRLWSWSRGERGARRCWNLLLARRRSLILRLNYIRCCDCGVRYVKVLSYLSSYSIIWVTTS